MEPQTSSSFFLTVLKKVLLGNAGIAIAVGIFGLYRGWHTAYQYGGGIVLAGIAVIGIGVASVMAYWRDTRSFDFQYGRSVSHQDISGRAQQDINEALRRYSFQIQSLLTGLLAIVIGSILQSI